MITRRGTRISTTLSGNRTTGKDTGYGVLHQITEHAPDVVNSTRRINHEECGDTRRRLYITRVSPCAVVAFCHNCQAKGYERKTLLVSRKVAEKITSNIQIPKDTTYNLPDFWKAYLYSLRFTDSLIRRMAIGYSPSLDRLIIPLYDHEGFYRGWAARSNTRQPKWLYPKNMNKDYIITPRRW